MAERKRKKRIVSTKPASVLADSILCEVCWEVCRQLGGINTVIRSKAPAAVSKWGDSFCMIGPYDPALSPAEFEEHPPVGPIGSIVKKMQDQGVDARFGRWLVTGRPQVVLLNPASAISRINNIKFILWEQDRISTLEKDGLVDEVLAFGSLVEEFFHLLTADTKQQVIGHFHEWMAASAVPAIKRRAMNMRTIFTTHATQLGRFLAMDDQNYFEHLKHTDWLDASRRYNIETKVSIERAAAQSADVMTTVSEITGNECRHLLGRAPDVLLPNGLNIQRFTALHEFQNLHRIYKQKINEFVVGHFFPSYQFNLDKTLYFLISGRYEYGNKGFDLAIESMARLNWAMKQTPSDTTIVFFIVTKADYQQLNSEALHSRAVLEELRQDCSAIVQQISERLFSAVSEGRWPNLDGLVDDYWKLRIRRMQHAWKSKRLPLIVTHDLKHQNDAILSQLRRVQLFNKPDDPVKVVYHPDFINASNPFFGMDYDQFVRGCHMGIFPSSYEPWGYAPLECMALGIPFVTSDLSGFGLYLQQSIPDHREKGMLVLKRRGVSFDQSANELSEWLHDFVELERRERINQRNEVESLAEHFDWTNLGRHYNIAHQLALESLRGRP